jgi:hypothetical protein
LYPDDYATLFAEERERDELEGKKWIDINGSTGDRSNLSRQGGASTATTYQEGSSDQSNVEAEE